MKDNQETTVENDVELIGNQVGQRCKQRREELGLTVDELMAKLPEGIFYDDPECYTEFENNGGSIFHYMYNLWIIQLCNILQLNISELFAQSEVVDLNKTKNQFINQYHYQFTFSNEDDEFVGTCLEFPLLSYLDKSPTKALTGIMNVVFDVVIDIINNGDGTLPKLMDLTMPPVDDTIDITNDKPPSCIIRFLSTDPDTRILGIRQIVSDDICEKLQSIKGLTIKLTNLEPTYDVVLVKGIAFTWDELESEIYKVCNEISASNGNTFTPSNKPTKTITWTIDEKCTSIEAFNYWKGFLDGLDGLIINTITGDKFDGTCDEGISINSPEEVIITMYCEGSNLEEFYKFINQRIESLSNDSFNGFDSIRIDRAETLNSIN